MPFATVPLSQWTSDDVAEWSRSIGEPELASRLTSNNVTGQHLQTLTDEELQVELGVDDAEQRARIMGEIRRAHSTARHAPRTTLKEPEGSHGIDREARAWLKMYLHEDVQVIQEHRQHHIHIPNEKANAFH